MEHIMNKFIYRNEVTFTRHGMWVDSYANEIAAEVKKKVASDQYFRDMLVSHHVSISYAGDCLKLLKFKREGAENAWKILSPYGNDITWNEVEKVCNGLAEKLGSAFASVYNV